jgi:peptidoglycan/xylan/chitin deacetylase (PgdA/CDA1 family)
VRAALHLVVVGALLTICPASAAAQSSDSETVQQTAAPAAWTHSVACPVLYTHEVVSQPVIRRFLTGLLAAGYQPATFAAVDAALTGAGSVPPGCVVLTFDDSLLSQFVNAAPVLIQLGLPAVFFALPGFSDGVHRYMGNPELQGLVANGFDVELHTCHHPNLPALARLNLNAFYAELQDCRRILQDIVGYPISYVAYPFGAYDATVLDAVTRFGFRAAFTTTSSAIWNYRSPYTVPRIEYDPSEAPGGVIRRIKAAGG